MDEEGVEAEVEVVQEVDVAQDQEEENKKSYFLLNVILLVIPLLLKDLLNDFNVNHVHV